MNNQGKRFVTVCDVDGTITKLDRLYYFLGHDMFTKIIIENDVDAKTLIRKVGFKKVLEGLSAYISDAKNPEFNDGVCDLLEYFKNKNSLIYISTSRAFTDKKIRGIYFRDILEKSLDNRGIEVDGYNYSKNGYAKVDFLNKVSSDLFLEDNPYNAHIAGDALFDTLLVHNNLVYSKPLSHPRVINIYNDIELKKEAIKIFDKKMQKKI